MRIFVTGLRGIPDIPGGIEKHCQELLPRIVMRNHEVLVCTRLCYVDHEKNEWRGIKLIKCFAPRNKYFEAFVHTFLAVIIARRFSPDVIHFHGIGPSLLAPMARFLGMKVVVTNHGPDYNRQKWGWVGKSALRLGEYIGGVSANEIISISSIIRDIVRLHTKKESFLIYNGVNIPKLSIKMNYLHKFGIAAGKYILTVARFVPEKGLHDLVQSFKELQSNLNLVIVGDSDHATKYSENLHKIAAADSRIILTGYLTGESLNQLYTHARLFVLPSYHEGLPISLLEALSYGISVLVSDIPANLEVGLPDYRYFRCGNIEDLKEKINKLILKNQSKKELDQMRKQIAEKYNWDRIADQTITVYEKTIGQCRKRIRQY